ncbi:SAGA complex subunit Sgf73 [Basidiobolus ranarum]|uniref:SAGA complex subunit Sgf73 n=1 Tax=Basidiobolus ranarum TaxID=34480 RepID=A0ABR2X328_9FUNG
MSSNKPPGWDILSDEQKETLIKKLNQVRDLEKDIEKVSNDFLKSKIAFNSWLSFVSPATLAVFKKENDWNRLPSTHSVDHVPLPEGTWEAFSDTLNGFEMDLEEKAISEPFDASDMPVTTKIQYEYILQNNEITFSVSNIIVHMSSVGGIGLPNDLTIVTCNNCAKPILPCNFLQHSEKCTKPLGGKAALAKLTKKTKKSTEKKKKSIGDDDTETMMSGKRLPTDLTKDKPASKKVKGKGKKATIKRVKGPLDLDRQCGVIAGPNNTPCTRSLTCKNHSMASKRAVVGRTQPYDILLQAYQAKNLLNKPMKNNPSANVEVQNGVDGSGTGDGLGTIAEDRVLDSDEEVNIVLEALTHSHPQPLATRPVMFVRRRHHCLRVHDVLLDAMRGPLDSGIEGLLHDMNGSANSKKSIRS